MKIKYLLLPLILFLTSCDKRGVGDLNTFDEEGNINSIVSISAGTVIPYEYDVEQKAFKSKIKNGEEALIEYLPPPFNFGIIPSTNKTSNKLIETLILSGSFSTGTLLSCKVLGGFEVKRNNETSIIVISIPIDENIQNIYADDINTLNSKYKNITRILKLWLSSNGHEVTNVLTLDSTLKYIKENSIR